MYIQAYAHNITYINVFLTHILDASGLPISTAQVRLCTDSPLCSSGVPRDGDATFSRWLRFRCFFWVIFSLDHGGQREWRKTSFLPPIIMEVENHPKRKETDIGGTHFPLPWLWEEGYIEWCGCVTLACLEQYLFEGERCELFDEDVSVVFVDTTSDSSAHPKFQVLTYISCMDTANVRESPSPKQPNIR